MDGPPAGALEAIFQRRSINFFDPTNTISPDVSATLLSAAIQAPSALNLQQWRFLVSVSLEARERLRLVAYDQPKITDGAAAFIVLGRLDAHRDLHMVLGPLLDEGAMDAATYDRQQTMVGSWYDGNRQACRDEAIRSASLAAMNLMTAAAAMGWGTCPLVGFDPRALLATFSIPDDHMPVMLIAVGQPASGNYPKKPRLPVDAVATIL